MAILSKVEAASTKGRLIHGMIILLLSLGGITMVYPFLIMFSGSLRTEIDAADLDLVPGFLVNDEALYRKFLERKYSQEVLSLSQQHRESFFSFVNVPAPEPVDRKYLEALQTFLKHSDLPMHWKVLGGMDYIDTTPTNLRQLRSILKERYGGDIDAYGRAAGSAIEGWLGITLQPPVWTNRRFNIADEPIWDVYFEMVEVADPSMLFLSSVTGYFLDSIIYPTHGRLTTEAYNKAHVQPLEDFSDFRLPQTVPGHDQPQLRAEWIEFVGEVLNPSFIATRDVEPGAFPAFLRTRYNTLVELNEGWLADFPDFEAIPLPTGRSWLQGPERRDYLDFLRTLDPEQWTIVGPEFAWADWLVEQGLASSAESAPTVPMAQLEYSYTLAHSGSLRWHFATINYVNVWDELVLEGRALFNTVIYCALGILAALLINPLAAYGLSRYQLPGTYKFLLILMATMAFPPMVALLPQYILLRNLGLMNTFIALLLPLAANGYLIFLLKGFFDSLPRELYEAARIDGASEIRMFFQITMALSKPILAVLALSTFTAAYASFLYPLLVAPNPDMWLIAVWLYQFQQRASSGAVFASVIIASIPTLVIFLFVQRTIMRGIIVPTEK